MPGKRKSRSPKTKEPTTRKQTKKKVVEESEEESPAEEKEETLRKRVTRGSTKKSTEPAKKRKKQEPIEEEEVETKPASKKATPRKKQPKAEKPVEEKEETKPAKKGRTAKEKAEQPIQKDEADFKSKSTSYETKNLPVSDSRAQARIKKAQTPSSPGEAALTVDLISTLFKAVREQLPSKMQDQMEYPNANPNSMTFYKQGFEDCLKLVKNKLPAEFAVDVGSAIVPTTPKNEVPAAEVLVAPARVIPPEVPIPNFKGRIFSRGDPNYDENRYQYAFSSVEKKNPGQIAPKHILYPKDDDDVLLAIRYAKENSIRIAIRTGGHQYSGASSTNGDNVLLDMSETYLDFTEENGLIKTGISHTLREFNHRLSEKGRFVPHGQCSHVHLGGHVQTGGYGQLGRSFGLFADHVQKIRIITAEEQIKEIERNTSDGDEKELFWAVLGGSPGNLGVLTHLWLKTYKNEDHPNSRGLKAVYFYSKDRLKRILDLIVDMEVDENFPRNYDLCVTVLSSSQLILPHLWQNADEKMKEFHPEIYGRNDLPFWGPMIVIYAQWADLGNLDPNQQPCDLGWFKKIKAAGGIPVLPNDVNYKTVTPMSKLTQSWVFGNVREFLLPYEKRTYMTNWTTQLQDTKWTEWVSNRIDEIQRDPLNGCKLSIQIQPFGGNFSAFRTNAADGKTAFSWRDSTICCVLDCFYDKPGLFVKGDPYITARQWQEQNDKEARGTPDATFCNQDRRVLWGSYDHDLIQAAKYYFEPGKWERILGAKKRWDPKDVFTANRFAVSEVAPTEIAPPVAMAAAHPYVMAPEQETEATYEAQMVSKLVERRESFLNQKQAESEEDKSLGPALKDEHQMARLLKSDTERMEHQTTKSTCCK